MREIVLEKKSQNPLYQQLMRRLKNDILAGLYPSGCRIPSEEALCTTYAVSRVTVRKALLELVQEGLLIRRQGKGTFVADKRLQRDLQHITSFTAACHMLGRQASTKLLGWEYEPAREEDIALLGIKEHEQVLKICRLRMCDDEPVMLEINRFSSQYDFLTQEDLQGSLYSMLREHGMIPSHAVHDIALGHATSMVSKHLGTTLGEALLLLDQTVYNQQDEPIHTSRQWIRGDRYTFRI